MRASAVSILIDALRPGTSAEALRSAQPQMRDAVLRLAKSERVRPVLGALAISLSWTTELSPVFAAYLRHGSRLSDPWVDLAVSYTLNAQRTADLRGQLMMVAEALDREGIAWYPLKGAALLLSGSWPQPETRTMTDLDLLIGDPGELIQAQEILYDLGYRRVEPDQLHHERRHQLTAMVLPGRLGSIELHRDLVPQRYSHLLPLEKVLERAEDGRLNPLDLALHIIVHARVVDQELRRARLGLRAVLDIGHLIATEPELRSSLITDSGPRTLRRAVRAHLGAVQAVFNHERAGTWWDWAQLMNNHERLLWWWDRMAQLPGYLRKDRIEVRSGRELSGRELISEYGRQVAERFRHELAQRRSRACNDGTDESI